MLLALLNMQQQPEQKEGTKAGKQHVAQPKKIAKKVSTEMSKGPDVKSILIVMV